jgi:four helix bundle protein
MPNSYISSVIGKQLLRSATSIGANIIEAQSASSKREFQNFYSIALKSANETKYWLDLLKRSGKCASSNVDRLIEEVGEISKIIAKSILTIKCR